MRIAFYMPFKPLNHPNPSGDLVIGTGLYQFLSKSGHDIRPVSQLRTRWLYWKPWLWARLPLEINRARRMIQSFRPHLWLTYHAYYKAPDMLGAFCAPASAIPYVIFQGVYATKYRRRLRTKPGFFFNRYALQRADAVFTNKRRDQKNLRRLITAGRLHYIPPGIRIDQFRSLRGQSSALRRPWGSDNLPVILTAAMFRPGVKADGVARVIHSCGRLAKKGCRFRLVICGDGAKRDELKRLARKCLGNEAVFLGQVPRDQMADIYRQADIFIFPGIQEGLGMVYLEAQAAGLPVVACNGWGASETVLHQKTGLLCKPGAWEQFEDDIKTLLMDSDLRAGMGRAASRHIAQHHDLDRNYDKFEKILRQLAKPSTESRRL